MNKVIDQTLEFKQEFLREQILEKGYDADLFFNFFKESRGEDGMDLDYIHYKDLEKVIKIRLNLILILYYFFLASI